MLEHIENQNIIITYQSGFRPNHSCETSINYVISDWKHEIEQNKIIIAVFIDLKRAFETVNHNIIFDKLNRYGIKSAELSWFKSLTNRTQCTKVNESVSIYVSVDVGLPQGAILSVPLFQLYINDVVKVIKHSKIKPFADDGLIYISGHDLEECKPLINLMAKDEQIDLKYRKNKSYGS